MNVKQCMLGVPSKPEFYRYNVGHMGLAIGDASLAYQCFRLSLSADNNHAESFNNLGVLELRKGNVDQAAK